MSIQAMVWALEQQIETDATARHVLLCLANYADKSGRGAFPSVNSLKEDTGLSVRAIRYKLEKLLEGGLIRLGNQAIAAAYIDRQDRRPVVYDIAMERGANDASRNDRGANDDTTGCTSEHNGVQMKTERGAPHAPNTSLTRQLPVNKPKEPVADAPRKSSKFDPISAKPENVSAEAWADWCQHRKEIRKPLTAKTCEQQAKVLSAHASPDAVINLSISNGWTGLFPEKAPTVIGHQQIQTKHGGFDQRDYNAGLTAREGGGYAF